LLKPTHEDLPLEESSKTDVQDISDEPVAKHARLNLIPESAGGEASAGGNSSAPSPDRVVETWGFPSKDGSSAVEVKWSVNEKGDIDVNAVPVPSSAPPVAQAKSLAIPSPPPRGTKSESPDRITLVTGQVIPKVCPAAASPVVQPKAAPEALNAQDAPKEAAVEPQPGKVDRSAINLYKKARLAIINTLSDGMDLSAPHDDFLKEIHYRQLQRIAALSRFVLRLGDVLDLCLKSKGTKIHIAHLHEAAILMKDCQSKVASLGLALSSVPDSLTRDDMILDMDAKCEQCRKFWKDLCEMHKFNYIENPCSEDILIPPFNLYTATGNCLAEFLTEVRLALCDTDFEKPLFVWKSCFVSPEIDESFLKERGVKELYYAAEFYKTLGPDTFENRISARRAQRKARPADVPAGGNSSAASSDRQLSMAETFPDYPIPHWFYLPSLKGWDSWITIRACGILRHDQRRASQTFADYAHEVEAFC
jgi:hypothetical protein